MLLLMNATTVLWGLIAQASTTTTTSTTTWTTTTTSSNDDDGSTPETTEDDMTPGGKEDPKLEEACLFLAVLSCLICCCASTCLLRRLRRLSGLSARYLSAELTQPLLDGENATDHEAALASNENEWRCPACRLHNRPSRTACDACGLSRADADAVGWDVVAAKAFEAAGVRFDDDDDDATRQGGATTTRRSSKSRRAAAATEEPLVGGDVENPTPAAGDEYEPPAASDEAGRLVVPPGETTTTTRTRPQASPSPPPPSNTVFELSSRQRRAARRHRWRRERGRWVRAARDEPTADAASYVTPVVVRMSRTARPRMALVDAAGADATRPPGEDDDGTSWALLNPVSSSSSSSSGTEARPPTTRGVSPRAQREEEEEEAAAAREDAEQDNADVNNGERSEQHRVEAVGQTSPSSTTNALPQLSWPEIERVSNLPFRAKHLFFERAMDAHFRAEGHARLEVRRDALLEDSVQQLLSFDARDCRRWMRVQFADEPGIDVGGLEREWFQLASKNLLDPGVGVFRFNHSVGAYAIDARAGLPPTVGGHPRANELYEFAGRLIGKAVAEHIPLNFPLTLALAKQLLGRPLEFDDLIDVDADVKRNLDWLVSHAGARHLDLDFSVVVDTGGHVPRHDLFENRHSLKRQQQRSRGEVVVGTRPNRNRQQQPEEEEATTRVDNDETARRRKRWLVDYGRPADDDDADERTYFYDRESEGDEETGGSSCSGAAASRRQGRAFSPPSYYLASAREAAAEASSSENVDSDSDDSEDSGGAYVCRELVPGGTGVAVDDANKRRYAERLWQYHVVDATRASVFHVARGLFSVVPARALAVFDAHELDLLLCGSKTVDVDDWKAHTDYAGEYRRRGAKHPVIVWFWKAVKAMDDGHRAKLLQFATGSPRVPCRGFKALQRNDGKYQRFCIQSLPRTDMRFPRAHTCFNRLDLPNYSTKAELEAGLKVILAMDTTGFTMD